MVDRASNNLVIKNQQGRVLSSSALTAVGAGAAGAAIGAALPHFIAKKPVSAPPESVTAHSLAGPDRRSRARKAASSLECAPGGASSEADAGGPGPDHPAPTTPAPAPQLNPREKLRPRPPRASGRKSMVAARRPPRRRRRRRRSAMDRRRQSRPRLARRPRAFRPPQRRARRLSSRARSGRPGSLARRRRSRTARSKTARKFAGKATARRTDG